MTDSTQRVNRWQPLGIWTIRLLITGALLTFMELAPGRWVSSFAVARPSEIGDEIRVRLGDPAFLTEIATTLYHTLVPLAVAATTGIASAWALWTFPRLKHALNGYLAVMYSTPRVVFLPLFILWVGIGSSTVILYVAIACYFIFLFNALEGFVSRGRRLVGVLEILGLNRVQIFFTYLLPAARPYLLAAFLIAFPTAVLGAIIGEMLVGGGLGGWIISERARLNVSGLYAATVTASVVAALLNLIVQRVGRYTQSRMSVE